MRAGKAAPTCFVIMDAGVCVVLTIRVHRSFSDGHRGNEDTGKEVGTVAGRESVGHAEEGIKAGGPDRLEQEAEKKKKKI